MVPHLNDAVKADLLASIPLFQRDARSKGIPHLGAGQVYPIATVDITVPDFTVPDHWRRAYGLDVGWNWTAATWGAWDEATDTVYLYACYKRGQVEPVVHTEAIRAHGAWIPGVNDPAAAASNQVDGRKLFDIYRGLGLNIEKADNAVTAGILEMWNRFSSGRLKVFASMGVWFAEFALYHRDEHGKIVKTNDHLLDATRYLVMSGGARAIGKPSTVPQPLDEANLVYRFPDAEHAWLGN
jgi:Terminase RNaseH-like domain